MHRCPLLFLARLPKFCLFPRLPQEKDGSPDVGQSAEAILALAILIEKWVRAQQKRERMKNDAEEGGANASVKSSSNVNEQGGLGGVDRTRFLVRKSLALRAARFCDASLRAHLADEIEANLVTKTIEGYLPVLVENLIRAIPILVEHFIYALEFSDIEPFGQLLSPDDSPAAPKLSANSERIRNNLITRKALDRRLDFETKRSPNAIAGDSKGALQKKMKEKSRRALTLDQPPEPDFRLHSAL